MRVSGVDSDIIFTMFTFFPHLRFGAFHAEPYIMCSWNTVFSHPSGNLHPLRILIDNARPRFNQPPCATLGPCARHEGGQ